MKKETAVIRISVGLNQRELDALNQALKFRYNNADGCTAEERGRLMRMAIYFYCCAIARLGKDYVMNMLACDVRRETEEEYAARVGERPPWKAAATAGQLQVDWFRENSPYRN